MTARKPVPPKSLGTAGSALWKALHTKLLFDPHELPVVLLACRQADDVALLEAVIAEVGATVTGSTGQDRLNPAITEARQGRVALGKLLAQLAIPAEPGEVPKTPRQRQAARAANVRWANRLGTRSANG